MRKSTFIKSMLLLCALIVGSSSAWAGDITATLTGTNMLEGSSPSTSYTNHSVTDNKGFTYSGKWTYQKNGSDYMNMIQIKKTESSNSSRIQLPTFDGPIKSITILATASDQTSSSGTGAKTTLLIVKGTTYSTSYANNAANQVLTAGSSGTTTNTYSFDFTTLNDDYDGTGLYICSKDAAIRIWSIEVVYSESDYYNVTYKYDDGVTADKVVQVAKANAASYTLDAAPSRTGFSFQGWNDGTNTYNGGAAYPITKAVIFTAKWSFTGTPTIYKKVGKSDIATGAQYIMLGVKDGAWGYASGISGSNTYIDSKAVESYSTVSETQANLTCETPLLITLDEVSDGWYLKDAEGHKLGLNGDKKVAWDKGDITWTLGDTDEPTFTASFEKDGTPTDYTMYYNAGSTRFNAYASKGSNEDAYFYRLDDGKDVYTLTLDFNDGATANGIHRVLEGATYTLVTPTRTGYCFTGWNTVKDGSGINYEAGGYTMPAAETSLYAQWSTQATAKVTAAGWATWVAPVNVTVPSGVEAYAVALNGTKTELTALTAIPGGTPVLLKNEGTYEFPVATETPAAVTTALKVSDGTITSASNAFVLAKKNDVVGFYRWIGTDPIPAGKVYLVYTASGTAPDFIDFGDATGIKMVNDSGFMVNGSETYNLNGQRVAQPTKGLYIVNGKKVIIK